MSLNPPQLEAVQHVNGPLLILAGAGTGKTRVLTHRIAHLVQNCDVAPGRILAVTFTNKAAGEMKKRIEQLIGPKARELWVGTFHSVCVKVLRKQALEAGIAPSFNIYDGADQLSVVKQVLKELNLDDKKFPPSSVVGRISRLKDELKTPDDLEKESENPYIKRLMMIYRGYQKILNDNNALDFGDLIFKTVQLFQKQPHILSGYQQMWQQILVDEYQDTNHAQYLLVSLLAQKHKNLSVVGDPDQSIYRWRGADLNNILNFEKDYPEAKVVRLEQNYRSVQNILKAAATVIANNELRKEKGLWSDNESGPQITVASLSSEKEEAAFVVEQLRQWHLQEKIPYSDMACFYRTNAQSRPLEEILRMAGIPYIIYGGLRFYERAEVKDALAYLRLLCQPQDSVALKRIVNVPARGIGKTTIDKIEALSQHLNIPFVDAAKQMDHPKLQDFLKWLEGMQSIVGSGHGVEERGTSPFGDVPLSSTQLVAILQKVLEESGMIRSLTAQTSSEAEDRLENLNELVASVADFESGGRSPYGERPLTLQAYLDQVALISDLDQNAEGGILPLMTLHLAKGLEFSVVGIVGLEEGLLPHARSQDEIEELEEERRLFYVGMTRAKKKLFLTHAWRRFYNGQEQYGLPSRFLEEMPQELLERIDKARAQKEDDFNQDWESAEMSLRGAERRSNPWIATSPSRAPRDDNAGYRIGSKVKHPDFGLGTIAASEKTSLGEKVTVKFANGMIKKLIAEYAKLTRM